MKEKLIELLKEVFYDEYDFAAIADHLIANGVIVPLCKVGDTIYHLNVYPRESECGECDYFDYGFGDLSACMRTKDGRKHRECITISERVATKYDIWSLLYFNNIGKSVFLTREEAEAALQKGGE